MEGRPLKNHSRGDRTTASSNTSDSSNRATPSAAAAPGVTWGLQQQQQTQNHLIETAAAGELLPLEPQISASSSFSEGAFECESPAVIMASQHSVQHDAPTAVAFDFQHQQPLASQSINSEDLLEDGEVAFGELAQPRPEIVLRWKRFAILVLVAVVFISGATAMLVHGIEMTTVDASKAEDRVDYLNSLFGIAMGFFESILGLLLGNLFPVFIVYLHNLKWFPGDNPAEKSSKFKKIALMLFIPAIMVALGNSFSAVQANQRASTDGESRMRTRHLMQQQRSSDAAVHATSHRSLLAEGADANTVVLPLEETILSSAVTRRVFPAPPTSASSCSVNSKDLKAEVDQLGGILQALPTAAFGFPLKNWNKQMYPEPASWSKIKSITISSAKGGKELRGDVSDAFATSSIAFELLSQGLNQVNALTNVGRELKLNNFSLKKYLSRSKASNASNLLQEITDGFRALGLGALNLESLSVTLQQSPLSSLIQLETMTVEIPMTSTNSKNKVACGSQSCVLLDGETDKLQLPRKQISMTQFCKGIQDPADRQVGACQSEENAAFLFGFTSTTSLSDASSSQESTGPKRSLVFSFGKLSWAFDDFLHTCKPSDSAAAAAAANDCRVLHHKLTPSNRHLVLGAKFLPETLQRSGRSGPIRLVQLVERKVAITSSSRALAIEYLVDGKQALQSFKSGVCSPAVDAYQQYVATNHLYLDQNLVQSMYTAALLYLFQNAVIVEGTADTVELAISRQRQRRALSAQATGDSFIEIYLSNTKVGQVSTWLGCGVILILSVLVMALPNERARLEPPRGGNARAERFIAVQTEEAYPNFVYKKRFLIGKTGEEIKFGEFAVESVGLHHKMEEDEQIYL